MWVFLKITQNSQENTGPGAYFEYDVVKNDNEFSQLFI